MCSHNPFIFIAMYYYILSLGMLHIYVYIRYIYMLQIYVYIWYICIHISVFIDLSINVYIYQSLGNAYHTIKVELLISDSEEYHPLDEKFIPDTIARKLDVKDIDLSGYETKEDSQAKYDELSSEKKDKDIIVRYTDNTRTTVTHTSQEIYAAVNEGTTVLFNNGGTNFHYLEGAPSVVNFYNCFYNNNVMQADVFEIRGNKITNTHF